MKKYGKKEIIITTTFIFLVIVSIIGITYAWFSAEVIGNDTASPMVVNMANLRLEYTDTDIIEGSGIMPGWTKEKTFTVENTGDVATSYDIVIIGVSSSFEGKDLVYTLTSDNGGGTKTETLLPNTDDTIVTNIIINPQVTQTYTITITFKETGLNQDIDQGKIYRGKLQILPRVPAVAISGYVTNQNNEASANKIVEIQSNPVSTTTDENGFYNIPNVPVGTHTIYVKDGENVIASKQIDIELGFDTIIKNEEKIVVAQPATKYVNIKVNNRNIDLMTETATLLLNEYSGDLYIGGPNKELTISGTRYGALSCTTSDNTKATCNIENTTLIITPGTETGTGTITLKEAALNTTIEYDFEVKTSSISLSSDRGTAYLGGSNLTATISGTNMGTLYCGTSSDQIAICEIEENILTINPVGVGEATITVREGNGNKTVNYAVTTERATYTVALDNQSAITAGTTSVTATYGLSMPGITIPTKTGYTFGGYYTGTEGTGTQYYNGTGTSTNSWNNTSGATLYAKWTANEYTLNLTAVTGATYAVTGCTTVTAGVKYTCTYGASVKVTATATTGYTVSSTLTGTNISNKTNGTVFSMPVPTSGTAVTLTATATGIKLKEKILLDNVEQSDSSISFSVNNESGLYYNSSSTYGENNTIIYYYRGNVNNNWVTFGGYKWRMLRTTSEGGVKLVYAGTGSTGLTNMLPTTANYTNFSTVINNWYTTWIASQPTVPNYLSTTAIYCHDKTISSTNSGNTQTCGYSYTYYNDRSIPTYACPSSYAYSVQNGNLSYPINTLSKDEAIFSGVASNGISFLKVGGNSVNNHILTTTISSNGGCYNAALGTSTGYYTIMESSSYITTSSAGSSCANTPLRCSYTSGYIRPVIALKACVKYSGGLGTSASPYTISTTGC